MHDPAQFMHRTQPTRLSMRAGGHFRDERGVDKGLHTHPVWEIVYYLEGAVRCQIGDEIPAMSPGMLSLIPPEVVHGEIVGEPWACYYIWLDGLEPACWPRLTRDDPSNALKHVCRALVGEWRSRQPEREQMLSLLLGQLDVLLRRADGVPPASAAERHVREFERLLEERFVEQVTIAALAQEIGVSYSYLRTQFVQLRGQTPANRLRQLRAQQALAMIRNSDQSLESIAEFCGYASASHLSRQIKQATGKRPGTFRHDRMA